MRGPYWSKEATALPAIFNISSRGVCFLTIKKIAVNNISVLM